MNSIDKLRKYVLTAPSICSTTRAILVGYVDNIEREVDDMWHALTIDAKPMTDENMAESGWVRLPVDAEGEYIHIGDAMESEYITRLEVSAIGAGCFFAWNNTPFAFIGTSARQESVSCLFVYTSIKRVIWYNVLHFFG